MNVEGFLLVTVIAVTVEALVEYGKSAVAAVGGDKKALLVQGIAVAVSVLLCLLTGADFYGVLGIQFAWAPVGVVLTGIFAARGSNYLADLIGRLRKMIEK